MPPATIFRRQARNLGVSALRMVNRSVARAADAARREHGRPPPGDSSVLDDLASRRPLNLLVKGARLVRTRRLAPGVTVVIVNWNTADLLRRVVPRVCACTPATTRVLVVDNGSTDGSGAVVRTLAAQHPNVALLRLPRNLGHGVALDIAATRVRTRVLVSLDSDAFPLDPDWLEPAAGPVLRGDATIAGLRSSRGFVHPVYLAIDVAEFHRSRLSFQPHWDAGSDVLDRRWGVDCFDTGELVSRSIPRHRQVLLDWLPCVEEGLPGMVIASVVYHHGGISRRDPGERAVALASFDRALENMAGGLSR